MRASTLVLLAAIAACGTATHEELRALPDAAVLAPDAAAAAPDAAVLPAWPLLHSPGRSAARVLVAPSRVILLEETLAGLDQLAPGPRRVRVIDRATLAERSWEAPAAWRIADIAVHPSGALSLAVVDEAGTIGLVRLDAELAPVAQTTLADPLAATDPIASDTPGDGLHANGFTGESVRVAPAGEELVVAVLTSRNSVVAYGLRVADAGLTTTWRTLVEPALGLAPFLPIGGSFDTFGAIVAWFRPALATDEKGHAYVAIWASPQRVRAHALVFDDGVKAVNDRDSDVLVSKLDAGGARLWSRVTGTAYEDEPYAIAAGGDEVVVAGRSRRNTGFDNSQWDPWLAALDGSGALLASRTLAGDASGIFLAVAVDAQGAIVAGGSDGWTQNPDGLSILSYGAKLLVTLPGAGGDATRASLPAGPRHNEVRSVVVTEGTTWYAGHEDGPLTHSGDGDRTEIHATAVAGVKP